MSHVLTHYDDEAFETTRAVEPPPRINGLPRSIDPRKGAPDPDTLPVVERDAYGRVCRVCGVGFTTTVKGWKTCSYACSRRWPEYRDDPSRPVLASHPLVGCPDEDECPLITPCHFRDADGNMTCNLDYDQHLDTDVFEHPGPIDGDSGNY